MFRFRLPGGLQSVCIVYFEFNIKYSRLSRKDWKEIFPAMSRVTSRLVSCKSTTLLLQIRINIFLRRSDILLQGRMCWSSSALSLLLVSNVSYWQGWGAGLGCIILIALSGLTPAIIDLNLVLVALNGW